MARPPPESVDTLWQGVPTELRTDIRKRIKDGLEVRIGGAEELENFYHVYSTNMRDVGTPVYPKAFFTTILTKWPGSAWIATCVYQGEAVASAFLLGFRGTLEIPWASSLKTRKSLRPNMLLHWECLRHAIASGFTRFDFGRSPLSGGTQTFKSQWGARAVPLYWQYWLPRGAGIPDRRSGESEIHHGHPHLAAPAVVAHATGRAPTRSTLPVRTLPPTGVPITSTDIARGLMASLGGPSSTERFVAAFASRFGVKYCRAVGSGRAALSIALQALGQLSRRRGIVIPAYTSFSVPAAVVRAGFRVTLCDVDPATLDFDLDHLGSLVDDDTLAVIPNHLFGFPAALEPIAAIARARGAFVVEDAAQAMGARYQGRLAGTLGDVGIYSLGRGKNVTALDGGIVVTNSATIAAALAQISVEAAPRLPPLTDLAKAILLGVLIRPALFGWPERIPGLDLGVSNSSRIR